MREGIKQVGVGFNYTDYHSYKLRYQVVPLLAGTMRHKPERVDQNDKEKV